MLWKKQSFPSRFLLFLGINALSFLVVIVLEAYIDSLPLFIFLAGTILATLFSGITLGIATVIIATLTHNYFFQYPLYTLKVSTTRDVAQLVMFFCVTTLIAWIGASLRKAYFEAEKAKTKLREESNDRAHLLSIVSHDLKNPLLVIKLNSQLILSQFRREKIENINIQKCAERITWCVGRMENLITSLLDFEKIKQGRLELDLKPENPASLINEVVETMNAIANEKEVKIEHKIPILPLPDILCDRERIIQVLTNLLNNAIKFTERNGLISIQVETVENQTRFCVRDTGSGINPNDLMHIFDPYWQDIRTARLGSGLGLSIAKGIVDSHGGHIWVESKLGEGSAFYFSIPKTSTKLAAS